MALTARYASSAGGGAHDGTTEADAWSWAEMLTNAAAGHLVNFKGGHTVTSGANLTNSGSSTSPIKIRGYTTTPGDAYQGRTNGSGPLVTTTMPTLAFGSNGWGFGFSAHHWILEGFQITGNPSSAVVEYMNDCAVVRCAITNSGTNASCCAVEFADERSIAYDCDLTLSGGSGGDACVSHASAKCSVVRCRLVGGPARCIKNAGSFNIAICNVFIKGAGDLYVLSAAGSVGLCFGNTVVGGTSDGFATADGVTGLSFFIDNLITDNGAYGVLGFDADISLFLAGNRYDRNTSGAISGATNWADGTNYSAETTGATQGNEYEDYASNDFRPKVATSPAVAAAIWPSKDIGAIQHAEAGGGGSGGSLARANAGVGAI